MTNDSIKNQCKITIGHLSKISGVDVGTVLYYQRIGLIDNPMTPPTRELKYSYKTAENIKFINHAQKLGFSLNEIKRLLLYWK
jgi:MerR family mercuric resistance operon transcriptional regulator